MEPVGSHDLHIGPELDRDLTEGTLTDLVIRSGVKLQEISSVWFGLHFTCRLFRQVSRELYFKVAVFSLELGEITNQIRSSGDKLQRARVTPEDQIAAYWQVHAHLLYTFSDCSLTLLVHQQLR